MSSMMDTQYQLKLHKLLGIFENLNTPLGFCLGPDNDVLVADTDNHRIVTFNFNDVSMAGFFGRHGTNPGSLDHPRKITMLPQTVPSKADNHCFVVCDRGLDRSRLQIFYGDGTFIRQIRIPAVEIVSGLIATQDRKIILVDSIRGEVRVLSEMGDTLFFFNCGPGVREPGDLAIHDNHYYICDFKGHNICVFDQTGNMVRKIGEELSGGLLNYPNGIEISNSGEVLVADSHGNNLHINVFNTTNGHHLGMFTFKDTKVSGCIGLKVTRDGRILTLSKNNHHLMVMDPIEINIVD